MPETSSETHGADEVDEAREAEDRLETTRSRTRAGLGLDGEGAYLNLLRQILTEGDRRRDRTGTGTLSIFGAQLRFDLRQGFPLLTTKKVFFNSVVRELLWFLRGSTNVRDDLTQHTGIWDAWADEDGSVGPVYGHQWRRWGRRQAGDDELTTDELASLMSLEFDGANAQNARRALRELADRRAADREVDQLSEAIHTIRTNPDSRRILVSAWNVTDVPRMRLPSCHVLFQFYVSRGHLDCQLYQRSADMALGVPFNIASYALLLSMVAMECRLVPRYFVHTFGDAHVYLDHVEGVREQLTREPLPPPRLALADKPVLAQTFEDVSVEDYRHHPAIKFAVSV